MTSADELAGTHPEPATLGRVFWAAALTAFLVAAFAFPVVLIVAEVGNALAGDFRSYGLCSAVSLVWLAVPVRRLVRSLVWDPPRLIRSFRYADGELEYRTRRHGAQTVQLAQIAGVYRRVGGNGRLVYGWSIRRADGEWLLLAASVENADQLIDRLGRDMGSGDPPLSPV